jgi:hypothetical protein
MWPELQMMTVCPDWLSSCCWSGVRTSRQSQMTAFVSEVCMQTGRKLPLRAGGAAA